VEPVYATVIGLVLTGFKVLDWKVGVRGARHLPRFGPAVIATNHVSYLDFIFIGFGARERGRLVRFMAKQEVFDKAGVGWLMRQMKHIPVDRYGRAADAFDVAVSALRRGELIGMFPEGTISRSFVPMAGKTGAARMAMAAQVPLIPSAVWGGQRVLTKGRPRNLQRLLAISVAYGEPLPYEPDEEPAEVTKRLMARITELLEELQSDYPQKPADDNDRWWVPAHLGGTAPTVAEAEALAARESAERRARRRAAGAAHKHTGQRPTRRDQAG
jgi:1-acyl-sn-glycerol-3-phosphate acyltransferase